MSPKRRLARQAVLYELFVIALVGPVLSVLFGQSIGSSLGLAAVLSTIALLWNYVFNMIFESWERRQASKARTLGRRLLHGIGFEGGLVVLLVPVMAWWLETTLATAFITNLGLLAFFSSTQLCSRGPSIESLAFQSQPALSHAVMPNL